MRGRLPSARWRRLHAQLAEHKLTGQMYAMKQLKKTYIVENEKTDHTKCRKGYGPAVMSRCG